jgi:hypothetical protein
LATGWNQRRALYVRLERGNQGTKADIFGVRPHSRALTHTL